MYFAWSTTRVNKKKWVKKGYIKHIYTYTSKASKIPINFRKLHVCLNSETQRMNMILRTSIIILKGLNNSSYLREAEYVTPKCATLACGFF